MVTSRNPARLGDYGWFEDVTVVAMDARESESTAVAFELAGQIGVVYYLLHGIGETGFRESDNRAAANVAEGGPRRGGTSHRLPGSGSSPRVRCCPITWQADAEVAEALHVDGGAEVVWLGAALIIGAGSTSFEILRYVGDRFPVLPLPSWMSNPSIRSRSAMCCITLSPRRIRSAYRPAPMTSAAPRPPPTATCWPVTRWRSGNWQFEIPVGGVLAGLVSMVSAVALPVPGGLTSDLTASP